MSADRLREAARVLRLHVDGLTTDTDRWDEAFPASQVYADKSTYERIIIHPGVGLALADWLDKAAEEWEVWGEHDRNIDAPLTVANLILGGAS